jgi:hypothetical protein
MTSATSWLDLEEHEEVPDSPEFQRILHLPRRPPPAPDSLREHLTRVLGRHANPYPGTLYDVQAQALYEAWRYGGLLAPIRVGGGKTLLCFLLPLVMRAERAVVVAPAALEQDYSREFAKLAQHWHGKAPLFLSYERLSAKTSGTRRDSKGVAYQEDLLARLAPDLLIFDEVHKVRNHGAVCTKRVKRYLQAHPATRVAATSGSLTRQSLKDFAHIALWTLRNRCPVPTTYGDLEAWSSATDELDGLAPRVGFGALVQLCTAQERTHLDVATVRGAVQRRLLETAGVISTRDGPLGIPLEVHAIGPICEDPAINTAFESVRLRWELPTGMPMVDALEVTRQAKTIGCGYFLDYQPRPPESWLTARRNWATYCRDVVRYNQRSIDSEALVKDHVRSGLLHDGGLLSQWERAEPSYDPSAHAVVEWISREAIETAAAWVEEHRGIVWTGNIALGVALSKALAIPFYGAEGMTSDGAFILDHRPGYPMIASKQANGTGRNLQRGWSRNLFFTTPGEQVIGRTHRVGQQADKVTCSLFVGCFEHVVAFEKELSRAHYSEELTGDAQRLVYAVKTVPSARSVAARPGFRWQPR